MNVWGRIQTSTKWQLGVISLLWVLFQPWVMKVGVTEDQFQQVLMGLWVIIGGQAAADFGKEAKKLT